MKKGKVTAVQQKNDRGFLQIIRWNWQLYLMLAPCIIYYIVFKYFPMYGIIISFKDFNITKGILSSEWADPLLKHFQYFFSSPYASQVIGNTLLISFYKLIFGMLPPVILAILISECKRGWFGKLVQTATYLPHFLSWVIIYGIMIAFFSSSNGLINRWLMELNLPTYAFMTNPDHFQAMIVGSDVWKGAGWGAIIYLAAITGIDTTLYEAARIDGCGRLKRIWYITLPMLRSVFILQLILRVGGILNAGFDQIYIIQTPQVTGVSEIIDTWVFKEGIQRMNYSLASAVGLFKSLIGMVLVLGTNALAKKWGNALW